jgi:hypothetical protein
MMMKRSVRRGMASYAALYPALRRKQPPHKPLAGRERQHKITGQFRDSWPKVRSGAAVRRYDNRGPRYVTASAIYLITLQALPSEVQPCRCFNARIAVS